MDGLLAASQAESRRATLDYEALFEQFQITKQLFGERDEVYRTKIKELEQSVALLSRKNDNLKFSIRGQNASKQAFAEDVAQLQLVAKLLEERETALTDAYENSLREISHKNIELEDLKDQIVRHEHHYKRLQHVLTDSTVPTSEFVAQGRKLRDLEESLKNDYVSKSVYEKVVDECNAMKLQMEKNMVEKSLYETLHQKHVDLERRLPVEYFPVGEYEKLKRLLQSVMDEKRHLEKSSLIVQEQRDEQLISYREIEAKAVLLKGRVENQEGEIFQLRQQKEVISQELLMLRSNHLTSEEDRSELREKIRELENAKNHLSTQCGHLKMQLSHESSAKQEAIEARKQVEKHIDQLRHDYNSRIIDSNQKMNDVVETSELQYKQRLQETTNHNQRLQLQVHGNLQEMDLLQQENERLRLHCRELENLIGDAKTQLTLQLASQETNFRENELLKQQEQAWKAEKDQLMQRLQDLQAGNQQMQNYVEEFRLLVFSELSPTFRKHLVKGEEAFIPNTPNENEHRLRVNNAVTAGSRVNSALDSNQPVTSLSHTQHNSQSRKDLFHEKMQNYISQQPNQSYQTVQSNNTRQFSHSNVKNNVSALDDYNEEEEAVVVIVPREPSDQLSSHKPALATPAMHRPHSPKVNSTHVRSPLTPASLPAQSVQQLSHKSILSLKTIAASNQLSTNNGISDHSPSAAGPLHPKTVMQSSVRLLHKLVTSPSADSIIPRTTSDRKLLCQQVSPTASLAVEALDEGCSHGGASALIKTAKQRSRYGDVNFEKPSLNNYSPRTRLVDSPVASPDVTPFVMTQISSLDQRGYSQHQDFATDDSLAINDHHVVASYRQSIR